MYTASLVLLWMLICVAILFQLVALSIYQKECRWLKHHGGHINIYMLANYTYTGASIIGIVSTLLILFYSQDRLMVIGACLLIALVSVLMAAHPHLENSAAFKVAVLQTKREQQGSSLPAERS